MKLSFENTEVAFAHKSNLDLKKAYRLFQAFGYPFLVNKGPALANFAISVGLPIKGLIKKTLFAQFCGGETIAECAKASQLLYSNGVGAILDYSVEGEEKNEDLVHSFEELKRVLNEAKGQDEYPIAVFKCTGIGKFSMLARQSAYLVNGDSKNLGDEDFVQFKDRFDTLCKLAYDNKTKLFVDAEETWIQTAIDKITYENMARYNKESVIIYNTIQLYRKDRIPEMQAQIDLARSSGYKVGFKLVRGAYMEKEAARAREKGYPNPIQNTKADTDADYNKALELCVKNCDVVSICAGTHNEESSLLLVDLLESSNIQKSDDRFWFAQLFGMSDHISYNLASAGYNVAKYLPYGPIKEVLPYLSRRAQENSSVKGQAGRELSLIQKELKRRKLAY